MTAEMNLDHLPFCRGAADLVPRNPHLDGESQVLVTVIIHCPADLQVAGDSGIDLMPGPVLAAVEDIFAFRIDHQAIDCTVRPCEMEERSIGVLRRECRDAVVEHIGSEFEAILRICEVSKHLRIPLLSKEPPSVFCTPVEFADRDHLQGTRLQGHLVVEPCAHHPDHTPCLPIGVLVFAGSRGNQSVASHIVDASPVLVPVERRGCEMEVVGMPVSHEGPHSRHSLVIAVALYNDFAGSELCAIRAVALEVPVDLLLHRIVRATL